jgi:uncharacterized protein YecT (DUF1311 family)
VLIAYPPAGDRQAITGALEEMLSKCRIARNRTARKERINQSPAVPWLDIRKLYDVRLQERSVARAFAAISVLTLGFISQAFAAGQAPAQESGSPQPDPCARQATDEAMWTCRHEQLDKSEADLAAIVGKLNASYDGDERTGPLKAAQDAWLSFRDAECKLLTIDSASGTMFDLYWMSCLTKQNVQRIAQMRWLADHP